MTDEGATHLPCAMSHLYLNDQHRERTSTCGTKWRGRGTEVNLEEGIGPEVKTEHACQQREKEKRRPTRKGKGRLTLW